MQFYITDSNPDRSAALLPDYALQKVNIREGYQILSDIGHKTGITWNGQNKLYSASHALTRSFMTVPSFWEFVAHYRANLLEYEKRFNKQTAWHSKFAEFHMKGCAERIAARLPGDRFEEVRRYLIDCKGDKLSEAEKERINY